MTEWLVDPMPCVQRAKPWKEACAVMTSRNEATMTTTRVVFTKDSKGRREWAFGHVYAHRDDKGVTLKVYDTPTSYTGTHALSPTEAQYAADVLRAAVADVDGKACAGKSIRDLVWDGLMLVLDRLMTGQEAADGKDPGRAEGMAFALAVFQNPYRPNIEAVREEAMERWYEENDDE